MPRVIVKPIATLVFFFYLSVILLASACLRAQGRSLSVAVETVANYVAFANHIQRLEHIRIEGNHYVTRGAILRAASLEQPAMPLQRVHVWCIRSQLEAIPFIQSADVTLDPQTRTLIILLQEKVPAARFVMDGSNLAIVHVDGQILTILPKGQDALFASLPLIQGLDAQDHLSDALQLYKVWMQAFDQTLTVERFLFVGKRRWDVLLTNGMLIRLPEDGALQAIRRLLLLKQRGRIDPHVRVIDLRLPDRVFMRFV